MFQIDQPFIFTFQIFKCLAFCSIYSIYVLPILDYCSTIYCPNSISEVKQTEKIQKNFTRKLYHRECPSQIMISYSDRLKLFNLPMLAVRRARSDLYLLFKISRGLIDVPSIRQQFSKIASNRLVISRIRKRIASSFFTHRASLLWNSLLSKHPNDNASELLHVIMSLEKLPS